ncbi:MAG: sigma 54-interacting transcriptional regulator [Planctomycetes bacterium]|nr:sigma 54-interacting transcriptional regulator [Planctomycetota bacterium]
MIVPSFPQITGISAPIKTVLDQIHRVAASDVSVLLSGETGTGKELVAQTIHQRSPRRFGPFVPVDCGAVPESLFDSELFGHSIGAFTGAESDRIGKVLAADGGTLFLDSIDHLSLPCQTRLLRVIQEREVMPLGETRTRPANFRLITSVSHEFPERLDQGRFRQDLYFRINVVQLHLPPLRERREDIVLLAELFLKDISRRFGKRIDRLDHGARCVLEAYDWPGNVRELQGVLECAVASARGEILHETDLPVYLRARKCSPPLAGCSEPEADRTAGHEEAAPKPRLGFTEQVETFQRSLLLESLERHRWSFQSCGRELGLARHQLKYLCAKLGIRRPRFDSAVEE